MVRVDDLLRTAGKIYIETAPWIYFLEASADRARRIAPIVEAIGNGSCSGVCSTIVLLEILVRPLKLGRTDLAAQYEDILTSQTSLTIRPVDTLIAREAARLRASYQLRTPDAIHLATAHLAGASVFLTNDRRLKQVRELTVVAVDELDP